jgi:endonuclease G
MIAFAIPANAGSRPLEEFVVSVDYLEDLLQMDFFSGLDDNLEESLEISTDFSAWNYTFMIGNAILEPID